jgi:hypothetical protein
MWIRKKDGTMENVDFSNYPQEKDKFQSLIYKLTGKHLYNYEKQKQDVEENLLWLLKELM